MPLLPTQSDNNFNAAGQYLGGATQPTETTFLASSAAGFGSQEATIPPLKRAVSVRQMMRWLVPEGPVVEMYINPQGIGYNYKKLITQPTRTKGGFVLQYWGEELTTLAIHGTTGSSDEEEIF